MQECFAAELEKGAAVPGWWSWYAIQQSPRTLIGSIGFMGQPDDQGTVTTDYSVTPGFEGRGYATEMLEGLLV